MRLKHWQGYGTVDARKTALRNNDDGTRTLQVTVKGMHEYGLVRDDAYDVHRWLVKRFVKDCPDYRNIRSMRITEPDDAAAIYEITYRPEDAAKR